MEITTLNKAVYLPDNWDALAESCFQTRAFLSHTEKYNPCDQRYYLLFKDGNLKTGAIVYTLNLNLLTYLSIRSPIRMNIAGIPCSVSSEGIIGSKEYLPELVEFMQIRERGLLLFLNLESTLEVKNMVSGRTLPTILLLNEFPTWEDYLNALRADYRRRVKKLAVPFSGIYERKSTCEGFNAQMYDQYVRVLHRSKGKLETLSPEFFQNLPSNFNLTAFFEGQMLIGWYITTSFNEKLYFFMGGVDDKVNFRFQTYFNILFSVIKEGIGKQVSVIDLGQTAEIPKVRLGGLPVEKFMLGTHSNRLVRLMLSAGKSLLEYSGKVKESHVFKKCNENSVYPSQTI